MNFSYTNVPRKMQTTCLFFIDTHPCVKMFYICVLKFWLEKFQCHFFKTSYTADKYLPKNKANMEK